MSRTDGRPPYIPDFNPALEILAVKDELLSHLRHEYLRSLNSSRSPKQSEQKRLVAMDDMDDWLSVIVERIRGQPLFAVPSLDSTIVPNNGPSRNRNSIYAHHRGRSWLQVLRTILVKLQTMTGSKWVPDNTVIQDGRARIAVLLSQFPEPPIYIDGDRI